MLIRLLSLNVFRDLKRTIANHVHNEQICQMWDYNCRTVYGHMRKSRGGGGGRRGGPDSPFLKNHKTIGFLSNTGPDPLKNHKATKPAFNAGPPSALQRNAI